MVPPHRNDRGLGAHEFAVDYVGFYGDDYVERTLRRLTPHSSAIERCALNAYGAGEALGELDPTSSWAEHVQATLKVAGAATCRGAMEQADAAVSGTTRVPPAKPSWQAQANKFAGYTEDGLEAGKYLHWAAKACAAFPRFC